MFKVSKKNFLPSIATKIEIVKTLEFNDIKDKPENLRNPRSSGWHY